MAFDFKGVAKLAMDKLFEKGYRDIAMLNSTIDDGFWIQKERIYREAMIANGCEKHILIEKDIALVDGGRDAMLRVLEKRTPKAVFCANDYMAIGALQVINAKKLSVPDDIAVIGNDNVVFCEMTSPRLTTVSLNMKTAGETAVKRLFERLGGSEQKADSITGIEYIERETV